MTATTTRFQRFRRYYVAAAVILLNTSVIVAVFWGVGRLLKETAGAFFPGEKISPVEERYGEAIFAAYPEETRETVRDLLWETWGGRHYSYEPFTLFKETRSSGQYVNVSEHGFRVGNRENPWPPSPEHINVFMLGGSTTFGYGVRDNQTIAAQLELILEEEAARPVQVYNFGRGYYFSTQELVLFLRMIQADLRPHAVLFVDGLNDTAFSGGEPYFGDRMRETFGNPEEEKRETGDTVPAANPEQIAQTVVDRYLTTSRITRAIAAEFEIPVLFIWQPSPFYHCDQSQEPVSDPAGAEIVKLGYLRMADNLPDLERTDWFLWAADAHLDVEPPLYVDAVHYNHRLSKRLAELIGETLLTRHPEVFAAPRETN